MLSERKTQDFARYYQSLNINSCELIVIRLPPGVFSLSVSSFVPSRVCSNFWSPLCITIDPWTPSNGKSAEVLSMANCGMRVAMDIGVIGDHVSRHFWPAGSMVGRKSILEWPEHDRPQRRGERKQEGWMNFSLPRVQLSNTSATNLLERSLIKARWRAW